MGLGQVMSRRNRCLWLLALFPAQELLAADQGDQQGKHGKHPLLDRQWRDTQLGGTLAIHPKLLPHWWLLVWGRSFLNAPLNQTIAACMPAPTPK
jgi:hypothetical protein